MVLCVRAVRARPPYEVHIMLCVYNAELCMHILVALYIVKKRETSVEQMKRTIVFNANPI